MYTNTNTRRRTDAHMCTNIHKNRYKDTHIHGHTHRQTKVKTTSGFLSDTCEEEVGVWLPPSSGVSFHSFWTTSVWTQVMMSLPPSLLTASSFVCQSECLLTLSSVAYDKHWKQRETAGTAKHLSAWAQVSPICQMWVMPWSVCPRHGLWRRGSTRRE